MDSFKKIVMGLLVLAPLAAGGAADAATLYVDPSFDTLAAGQYLKITDAVAAAQSGDTIRVAAGDYADLLTVSKGLTLQGSGPQYTRQNNTITLATAEPVKITGFTVTSPGNGIQMTTQPAVTDIYNNCITGNGGEGISINTTAAVTSYVTNIVNNTITGNGKSGVYIGNHTVIQIISNVIAQNAGYGLFFKDVSSYTVSRNLLNGNNGYLYACSANRDYCWVSLDTHDNPYPSTDPLFVDAGQGNFALQAASPAKNQGKLGASYVNPDGTRNDMGAFGGPGATSFWPYGYGPVVTDISATPMRVNQGGTITINATAAVR